MVESLGRWLMLAGAALLALGGALWLAGRFGLPLGRLPGDWRWEWGQVTVYVPLATSLIVSVILTILLNLAARWFNNSR